MNKQKIFGWLLIIGFSLFSIIYTITLISSFFMEDLSTEFMEQMPVTMLTTMILFLLAGIFGIWVGISKVKSKPEIIKETIVKTIHIKFSGSISYKDYKDYVVRNMFKKKGLLILPLISIVLLASLVDGFIGGFENMKSLLLRIAIPILTFIVMPFLVLTQIKKRYYSSQILQEHLEYEITEKYIKILGDSIDSMSYWTLFTKITESNKFWLLHSNDIDATFVNKNLLTSDQQNEFSSFVQTLDIYKE